MIGTSDTKAEFHLWPYGWAVTTTSTISLEDRGALSILFTSLTEASSLRPLLHEERTINIQGRGKGAPPSSRRPRELPSHEGELLVVAGTLFTGTAHSVPFWIQNRTRFESFQGSHSIIHAREITQSESVPHWLSMYEVGNVFPASLEYVSLTLEFFKAHYISTMIGFSPTVTGSATLEATPQEILLTVSEEGLRSRSAEPLKSSPYIAAIRTILAELPSQANSSS